MKRGDIWIVGGGVYAKKPRPALVIQDGLFALSESVTVIPLTSQLNDAPLFRVRIGADETTGIRRDSDVMVDKITTIKRLHATERVGCITDSELLTIERLLMAHLGIAR